MQTFATIITLSIIAEALVEYLTSPLASFPSYLKAYAGMLFGVVLCVVYGADMLALLGYHTDLPYIGAVLTGLLIGRGSNIANDLISRINVVPAPAEHVDAVVTENPS
jgi:hypothetical protein